MDNKLLSNWLWCQLSIAKLYLDMLDYTDPVVIERQESDGWTRDEIITALESVAETANEIARQATRVENAPTANTARCISRLMSMGIKLEPAITAGIWSMTRV